jgi:hypothetical protein
MIPLATFKMRTRITDSAKDAQLQLYIDAAAECIELYCEQPFQPKTIVLAVTTGMRIVFEVQSVTALEGRNSAAEAWQTLPATAYALDQTPVLPVLTIHETPYREHRATLVVGYADVPYPLQEVCYEMAKEMAQDDGVLGQQSTFRVDAITRANGGDTVTTKFQSLAAKHRRILDRYRVIVL